MRPLALFRHSLLPLSSAPPPPLAPLLLLRGQRRRMGGALGRTRCGGAQRRRAGAAVVIHTHGRAALALFFAPSPSLLLFRFRPLRPPSPGACGARAYHSAATAMAAARSSGGGAMLFRKWPQPSVRGGSAPTMSDADNNATTMLGRREHCYAQENIAGTLLHMERAMLEHCCTTMLYNGRRTLRNIVEQ